MKKSKTPARVCALLTALVLALGALSGAAAEDAGTVYIDSAAELEALAADCSLDTWSQGRTVVLRADISLEGSEFVTIPIFCGVFDGGGHTVSGLSITGSAYPAGLFGIVAAGAAVKDLKVCGAVSPSGDAEAVAGIAGINYGAITDCSFTGTVSGKSSTGGIAGINGATGAISGCSASGGVFGQHATGGIAGSNLGTVSDCSGACYVNIASVDPTFDIDDLNVDLTQSAAQSAATDGMSAPTDTGGIAGYSSGVIQNCVSSGATGYQHIGYNVGGIAGRSCGYITCCCSTGTVYGRKDVGGIVGQMEPYIDMDMSEDLLGELAQEIDTLSELIDKTIDDMDGSVQTAAARMDKMADYMDAAAQAVGNMWAYASVTSTVVAEGTAGGSASGEATVPSVTVEGSADENGASVSAGIGGEAAADGSGSAQGAVTANSQIAVNASQYQLSAALAGMTAQLRLLNGEMAGASTTLTEDVRAINEQADRISDTAMELFSAAEYGSTDSLVTDASDVDVDSVTLGKALLCENSGSVCGDIDVGGIAGSMAIEYELDPEDDVSSELTSQTRSRYELKAVVQSCVNSGKVTSKKDCAGGVCGRVDLGLILGCVNCGGVESESGDYTGGIAGLSASTVRGCWAKCTLSGRDYVGGIVGSGSDGDTAGAGSVTAQCYSIVRIEESAQYAGAVSGSDKGEFSDNYFVSDELAGLGQTSYAGRAEPVTYERLLQDAELPEELRSFTLEFVADGAVIETVPFEYGESLDASEFPEIPEKDGCYAGWDADSLKELRFDTVVTAVYTPYITALSSEETRSSGRPILYVEGAFCVGDSLGISAQANTPSEFDLFSGSLGDYFSCFGRGELPQMYVCREIVEQWSVTIPDDGAQTHTVRYLSPDGSVSGLRVYCLRDGRWSEADSEAVGSCLSFEVSGNDVQFAVLSVQSVWWVWVAAAALLTAAVLLIVRAVAGRRKRSRESGPESAPAEKTVPAPEKKRKKRPGIVVMAVILLLAAVAVVLFLGSDLRTGVEALYLLRDYSGRDTLNMELTVEAQADGESAETQASVGRVTDSGSRITVIEQDGVCLYCSDGTVYLENGRAYGADGLFPDYSELIGQALGIYETADVSCVRRGDGKTYTVTAADDDAMELLRMLLPAYAERLSSVKSVSIELEETDGALSSLRFSGSGTLDGGNAAEVSVTAVLTVLPSDDAAYVPQEVLYAVRSGAKPEGELGEAAFDLLTAWAELKSRDPLCADIHVAANCGPLLVNDELEYFRVLADGTEISCVRKNSLAVYFTEDRVCLADGSAATDTEASAADCARLISVAYEACLNGGVSVEEAGGKRSYTLSLDEEGMAAAMKAIAPDAESMDITLTSGSIRVDVADGVITAVELTADGSARIVAAQVSVSFSAELSFDADGAGRSCEIPDGAAEALKK